MNELFNTNFFFIPLVTAAFIHLLFLLLLYSRLSFRKRNDFMPEDHEFVSVSVIIVAKNEADNLYQHLPLILNQDYPDFEVIVVDDQSTDNTLNVLKAFKKHYENLQIVYIGQEVIERQGKKLAISLGIKKSKNTIILLTDADCYPLTDKWIRYMARNYSPAKSIVIGFSPYESRSGLLNYLIQYDTFHTALNYINFALAGMPYMGVGRNLMYSRSLFFKHAFNGQLHIPFGDDDLFINKIASASNTTMEFHPNSFVISKPHTRFIKWYRQKKRHFSTGKEYKFSHKFWLGFSWATFPLFLGLFVGAILINPESIYLWGILAFRYIFMMIIYSIAAARLKMKKIIWTIPFMELIYNLIYIPVMGLISLFSKKRNW